MTITGLPIDAIEQCDVPSDVAVTKQCSRCGIEKLVTEFSKNHAECKNCSKKYMRQRRSDPEVREQEKRRDKERQRLRYSDPEFKRQRKEYERQRSNDPEVIERRKEYERQRRSDPEIIVRRKEYRSNPEYKEQQQQYRNDPEFKQRSKLNNKKHNLKKYGLTTKEYYTILEQQGGGCFYCGKTQEDNRGGKRLGVDHCHTTGLNRRIICHACNVGIGYLRDDPTLMRKIASDLEYFQKLHADLAVKEVDVPIQSVEQRRLLGFEEDDWVLDEHYREMAARQASTDWERGLKSRFYQE